MNFQIQGLTTLVNENLADASTTTNTFNSYRYTFVADSTTTTLRFADISTATNSVDLVLDNVQAYAVTTTTPSMSISENSANGTVVGQVTSTDPDAYGVLSYSLTNNANGRFAINSSTGVITVASGSSLDFEAGQSHTIVVRTTDQGGLTFDKTVTINLTNVNEAPVDLRGSAVAVTVPNFSFESDALADGNWTGTPSNWSVTGTAGVGNPTTGNLSSGNPTDGLNYGWARNGSSLSNTLSTNFDSNQNYQLTVDFGSQFNYAPGTAAIRLYAGGTLIGSYTSNAPHQDIWNTASFVVNGSSFVGANGSALRIELANTSGSASEVLFDNVRLIRSAATASVAENAANGTVVGTVVGLDLDAANTFSYSLTNNAGGRFAIGNSTGQITVADGTLLNFEAATSHTVVVQVADQGGLTYSRTVTISLTDVNETPTSAVDAATALEAGGTANGTAGTNPSGNVLTNDTDVDAGDTKTVSGVAAGVVGSASTNVGSAVTGTYGSINIAANGNYTYTVDNNNSAVQALRTTANTLTDVFTYTMRDTAGLTSTTQITVTIQVPMTRLHRRRLKVPR